MLEDIRKIEPLDDTIPYTTIGFDYHDIAYEVRNIKTKINEILTALAKPEDETCTQVKDGVEYGCPYCGKVLHLCHTHPDTVRLERLLKILRRGEND